MEIQLVNVSKKFNDNLLFGNVNATFSSGELIALTGKSGTGKTTLLNCIGLLEKITGGDIFIDNHNVSKTSTSKKIKYYRDTIGFVFQNYGLVSDWTVEQNLELALKFSGLPKQARKNKISNTLKDMGLQGREKTRIYSLSGGEQQRVALAETMLKDAKIILCDEPSAALDIDNANIIINILKVFAKRGAIVIVATHDQNVVSHCTNVFSLENERLVKKEALVLA
jgi:putative ABC transport system ATP-binding protein